ncbi:MAG: hypothetical protein HXS48_25240 [Theionarchaea archaeon]|nr:MAG: hypothetical protein AYK19_11955 [Theionarchaea archaeon DG-70-1]MBU7030263.1 hypothetical protein [Theionarchaea archaeon]
MNMKAKTLSEMYALFDPQEPLKGEKLKTYYVDRKSKIKEEVLWKIKNSRKPLKILFPAIRGNRNTTELNKLCCFSLVILEYFNNEVWYDVHPTIKGITE